MDIGDRLKDLRKKAEDTAAEHKEQIHKTVEKAEQAADQRTEGRYHEQIAKAGAKVDEYVENLQPDDGEGASQASHEPGAASTGERSP